MDYIQKLIKLGFKICKNTNSCEPIAMAVGVDDS